MSFAEFDGVLPRISLSSRVVLALAHATIDSNTQPQVVSFGSAAQDTPDPNYNVAKLLQACQQNWDTLTADDFPRILANGTAALNGFRHYMIQDASYLEHYYRVRMEAVSRNGTLKEVTEFAAKLTKSLQYVAAARSDCTTKLGVPEADVANEAQSDALKNSIKLYGEVASTGDSWLDIHIALSPCILGYDFIANKLVSDPATIRNTVYFPLWIQAMAGGSSAKTYTDFINSNIKILFATLTTAQKQEKWNYWITTFNTACTNETNFFLLGSSKPAYKIVSDRVYKIRSYLEGNPYLAVNDSLVITQTGDPGDSGKWTLANSTDGSGYTIKLMSGNKFLGAPTGGSIHQTPKASVSAQVRQPWSINPAGGSDKNLGNLYQLLLPAGLPWVLDIDSTSNVVVANNSQVSSQLWLLEPA